MSKLLKGKNILFSLQKEGNNLICLMNSIIQWNRLIIRANFCFDVLVLFNLFLK